MCQSHLFPCAGWRRDPQPARPMLGTLRADQISIGGFHLQEICEPEGGPELCLGLGRALSPQSLLTVKQYWMSPLGNCSPQPWLRSGACLLEKTGFPGMAICPLAKCRAEDLLPLCALTLCAWHIVTLALWMGR
jgi:hypothetical protein